MLRNYTYKFRLLPTEEQKVLLAKHFGCNRFIYNHFLEKSTTQYKEDKKSFKYYDYQNQLPKLKEEFVWLKEVNSQSLQYAVRCLDTAYKNFFTKIKKKVKGKKGFPKFKSKHKKETFRITQNVQVKDNKIIIPKFQEGIEFIPDKRKIEGNIDFATITKNKANQYFVSITTTRDIEPLPKLDTAIGIDMNKKFIVDSNNKNHPNPLPFNQNEKRIKLLNQALARTRKGTKDLQESNGRKKARVKLAKLQLYISNVREDFLHKLSKSIIDENQVICIEDLDISNMLKNIPEEQRQQYRSQEKKHHKDVADAGWRSLRTKLEYKTEWYGRDLVVVDRFYPSSQICNHCGKRYEDLPIDCKRWWCSKCWHMNDRDFNASKNILDEAMRILESKRKLLPGTEDEAGCPGVRLGFTKQLVGPETSALRQM